MRQVPVLIVGGGPTGLAAALEFAYRGIQCLVLEEGDGSVDHPRLGVILMRTMEFCRRWNISDRVYNCGFQNNYPLNVVYCTSLNGFLLGKDVNPSCADLKPPAQSPEKRQRCPQIWFNPLLERAAKESPLVEILHFQKFRAFHNIENGVEADIADTQTGATSLVRSKYLIACDGASSAVREQLGIEMKGNPALSYSVNIFIRSPALLKMHDKGPAERYIFVGPNGTWANMTVVDGRELWRITVIGNEQMMDMNLFDARDAIERCIGRNDVPYELISVKPWRRTELTAAHFRFGHVFLAGDAAHTMSPTGGHGMSTGIADIVNLAWKIDATMAGWGGPHLLDTYESERRPIAVKFAAASASNFRAWVSATDCSKILDETEEGTRTRKRIGDHMLEHGREDWDSIGLQLGYRYDNSPICIADGTPVPDDTIRTFEQTARPGARAPHAWLEDGRSTLDLFGKEFVLLRIGEQCPSAEPLAVEARAQGLPMKIHSLSNSSVEAMYRCKLALVRPDGHVAWRGDALPKDVRHLVSTVRGSVNLETI